jgi:hypothetical protein
MAEQATQEYFERIDNASLTRHFSARIEVYFDGELLPPTVIDAGIIQNYSFVREAAAEDTFPLGRLSSSTLTLNLNNVDQRFTSTNTSGAYYGKLKQGVKMVLFTGLLMANGSYEEKQMGVVYSSEWDVTSSTIIANVLCRDRLYFLAKKPLPKLPVFINTNIASLFKYLFSSLGLSAAEYIIDSTLDLAIPFGWLPGITVGDALAELTKTGICRVYVNRYNQIVVSAPYKQQLVGRLLSADCGPNMQIKTVSQQQSSYKAYTGVTVKYNNYIQKDDVLLATIPEQKLDANLNEFKDVAFSVKPVASVNRVIIQNTSMDISSLSVGASSMNLNINSTISSEKVEVRVYGKALYATEQTIDIAIADEASRDQVKHLEVESLLMQSKEAAKRYAASLNQIVTDPGAYLSASLRGDLTFDIGDVYVFDDPKHKINMLPVYFTRIQLDYSGGLTCEVDCTKYTSLAIYDYAYIGPGLTVKFLREK